MSWPHSSWETFLEKVCAKFSLTRVTGIQDSQGVGFRTLTTACGLRSTRELNVWSAGVGIEDLDEVEGGDSLVVHGETGAEAAAGGGRVVEAPPPAAPAPERPRDPVIRTVSQLVEEAQRTQGARTILESSAVLQKLVENSAPSLVPSSRVHFAPTLQSFAP